MLKKLKVGVWHLFMLIGNPKNELATFMLIGYMDIT